MSSINQTRDRMINNKGGIPVPTPNTTCLANLKSLLDSMYAIRNKTEEQGVKCSAHTYDSYTKFQEAIKKSPNAMSVGDYNRALNGMATCTCDARTGAICECVSRQGDNFCSCNSRIIPVCLCVSRVYGKYNYNQFQDKRDCECYIRTGETCECVQRTPDITCNCNSRCSCNALKEFTSTTDK